MLHQDDHFLFQRARELCLRLAESIGEECVVEPKRRPQGAPGLCYCNETPKRIAIKIREKAYAYDGGKWHKNPEPWSEIARTCAHEVAHLKYSDHGKQFRELEKKLNEMI